MELSLNTRETVIKDPGLFPDPICTLAKIFECDIEETYF